MLAMSVPSETSGNPLELVESDSAYEQTDSEISDEPYELEEADSVEETDDEDVKQHIEPIPGITTEEGYVMFTAIDKDWLIADDDKKWFGTRDWIASLGNGWRMPELYELKELYCEVQQASPIGERVVWADRHGETTANIVYFGHDFDDQGLIEIDYFLPVAVRDKNSESAAPGQPENSR